LERKMKQTIVFDFDGVIHSYTSGWLGADVITDDPVSGIREAIKDIRDAGYEVVVLSARCTYHGGIEAIEEYLVKHNIVVDSVSSVKVPAIVYIDDCAICFDGKAETLLDKIKNFKPWHKQDVFK